MRNHVHKDKNQPKHGVRLSASEKISYAFEEVCHSIYYHAVTRTEQDT